MERPNANGFAAVKGGSGIDKLREVLDSRIDSELYTSTYGDFSVTSPSPHMEQGDLIVAFNGYLEDRSGKPEEEIAELYREHREDFLKQLNGSFRLVLYDTGREQMHVSADKIGRKVIYFTEDTEDFVCASHLTPLLSHPQVDRSLDLKALGDFLQSWSVYFGGGRRLIDGVRRLEPSHQLIYSNGEINTRKFWDIYNRSRNVSDEEAAKRLDELLSEAAENLVERVDGDINVFLSGGFDSVFLTTLISEVSDRKINSYTWGWKDEHFSDAEKMSDKLGTDQHSLRMDYSLPSMEDIRFYEEPHNAFVRYPFRELYQDHGMRSYWTGLNSQATFPVCLKNVRKLDRAYGVKKAVRAVGTRRLERLMEKYGSYKLSKAVHVFGSDNLSTAIVDDWGMRQDQALDMMEGRLKDEARDLTRHVDRKWELDDRSYQGNYSYLQLRARDTSRYAYYAQDMEHMDVFGYTPLAEYSYSLPMQQKKNRRLLQKIAKGRVPDRIITKGASGWEFVSEQFRRKIVNNREEYERTVESFLDRGYLDEKKARNFLIPGSYDGLTKGPVNQMIAVFLLEKWIQTFIEEDI